MNQNLQLLEGLQPKFINEAKKKKNHSVSSFTLHSVLAAYWAEGQYIRRETVISEILLCWAGECKPCGESVKFRPSSVFAPPEALGHGVDIHLV